MHVQFEKTLKVNTGFGLICNDGTEINCLFRTVKYPDGRKGTLEEFKDMCFKNNFEGTLWKIYQVELNVQKAEAKIFGDMGVDYKTEEVNPPKETS